MIDKTVTGAQLLPTGFWSVTYRVGAEQHEHRFPHVALLWRAAEYGIDPADSRTLLDIVLHEPHIDTRHDDPHFVYDVDEDTARTAHLAKIAAAKQGTVRIADPDDHLEKIHALHTVDPADHRQRVQQVASLRRNGR